VERVLSNATWPKLILEGEQTQQLDLTLLGNYINKMALY
jgi:hypothetical protein